MILVALIALVVGLVLLALGLFFPIQARLGWRHATRHKRQTAFVVVGLLVGTAVISGSLVTGDSLHAGLRDTATLALGRMDIIVNVPGDLPVSENLLGSIVEEPLPESITGSSRILFARAGVENLRTDRFAPRPAIIGFDAAEDAAFGVFHDAATGETLTGDGLTGRSVYVNERLANRLGAREGDTLRLVARPLFVPVVPDLHWFNGTLVAASATPAAGGGWTYTHSPQDTYAWDLEVPRDARGIIALLAWQDPAAVHDLDLTLVAPDGTRYTNDTGTPGARPGLPLPVPLPELPDTGIGPLNPVVLTLPRDAAVEGTWTLEVHGKLATNQAYTAVAAPLRVEYDIERALAAIERLREAFGDEVVSEHVPDPLTAPTTTTRDYTVHRVVAQEEKGVVFGLGAVFMARSEAQDLFGAHGLVNWLKVTQGVRGPDGGGSSADAVEFLEARLEAARAAAGGDRSGPEANLRVTAIKQDFLERSEEASAIFTRFLALIGSFTLLAGLLLIVNVFTMLGEERRRELAVARAVGLTRGRLFLAFLFEGAIYTLLAAAAGAIAGIGLAAFLVWGVNSLSPPEAIFRVPLAPRIESLTLAFALGALVTFATVFFAAWRAGRFDIAAALTERRRVHAATRLERSLQLALLTFLITLSAIGILLGSFLALSVLPLLALLAAAPVLARWIGNARAWQFAGVAVILVLIVGLFLLRAPVGLERDLSVLARALILVIAGSILFVRTPAVPRLVARLFARSTRALAPVRVAFSYPQERPLRTGLTLSMYSLVILVLVVFSIFFTVFTPDLTQETGGYDLSGRSPVLLDDAALRAAARPGTDPFADVARVDVLAERTEFGQDRVLLDGKPPPGQRSFGRFMGFDADFATHHRFPLYAYDPALAATEEALWARVATDPGLVIISYALIADHTQPPQAGVPLPERLTLNGTTGAREYRIAGIMEQTWFGGVWLAKDEVLRVFPDAQGHYLFRLAGDAEPRVVRAEIERAYRGVSMDVSDLHEEAREVRAEATRVYQLLTAYLGLGLVVGVASLGIVTSRAVFERRRETGVLRAMGFTQRMITWTFLAEVLLILSVAVILGVGLGIVVARAIYEAELSGLPGVSFLVPWGRLLAILAVTLIATLLAVLIPVRRAARASPAEAIRTVD